MQPALHQREACCISHEYKSRSLWLVTFRSTKIHRTNQIARHEIKIYYAVTDLSMQPLLGDQISVCLTSDYPNIYALSVRSQIKISGAHPFHRLAWA